MTTIKVIAGGAGVFEPRRRRVAQLRDRHPNERAAEVLRHEAGVEVADEDAVDVGGRQAGAGAGDRGQRGAADELLQVQGVELAEGRVAPAEMWAVCIGFIQWRSVCSQPAAVIVVRSPRCGPTICTPIGRPSRVVATGATVAGRPTKLARPAHAIWSP